MLKKVDFLHYLIQKDKEQNAAWPRCSKASVLSFYLKKMITEKFPVVTLICFILSLGLCSFTCTQKRRVVAQASHRIHR